MNTRRLMIFLAALLITVAPWLLVAADAPATAAAPTAIPGLTALNFSPRAPPVLAGG